MKDIRVAFVANPPRAEYIGGLYRHLFGWIPFTNGIYEKITKNHRGPEYNEKLVTQIAINFMSSRTHLLTDKCRIPIETENGPVTIDERVYTVPLTNNQITNPENKRLVREWGLRALRLAEKQGAVMAGLGAAVKNGKVTNNGRDFVDETSLPISNGNNYTIGCSIEVLLAAAAEMEIDLDEARFVVVGAAGSIGRICAEIVSQYVPSITLVGRPESGIEKLVELRDEVKEASNKKYGRTPEIYVSTDLKTALRNADGIISATDSSRPIIYPDMVKPKSVIVDVARPHDTPRNKFREFIERGCLPTDGGIVYHEGDIHLRTIGTPPGYGLACFFEPAILVMAGKFENYVETNIESVEDITNLGRKFGFKVDTDTFRFHYKRIEKEDIDAVKSNSQKMRVVID